MHRKSPTAFSLIELIACVAILGALAMVVIPRISDSSSATKDKACKHNCVQLNSAINRYFLENDAFPPDLATLEATGQFPDGIPVCPVSGSAYTINTTTQQIDNHPATHP